ncbi:hypothetical protein EVA_01104 [gut metagenome]|uniref:Uncharacterized protein n=1 Tax=gut metagenome TaxID=749906 RepID=J9GQB9_9ZZZZ
MLGFGISSKDTCRLVTIEYTSSLTNRSKDIILTINRAGITMDFLQAGLNATAIFVERISLNSVEFRSRKIRNLILIVTDGETSLPTPILVLNQHRIQSEVYTLVLHGTIVGPHKAQARDIADRFTSQEVCSLRIEVFHTEIQTILEEATLQTNIETVGGFPLEFGVLDVRKDETCQLIHELEVLEVRTACVVVDIIVTTHVVTSSQFQVIDTLHIKPFF